MVISIVPDTFRLELVLLVLDWVRVICSRQVHGLFQRALLQPGFVNRLYTVSLVFPLFNSSHVSIHVGGWGMGCHRSHVLQDTLTVTWRPRVSRKSSYDLRTTAPVPSATPTVHLQGNMEVASTSASCRTSHSSHIGICLCPHQARTNTTQHSTRQKKLAPHLLTHHPHTPSHRLPAHQRLPSLASVSTVILCPLPPHNSPSILSGHPSITSSHSPLLIQPSSCTFISSLSPVVKQLGHHPAYG
jgi:hypothetical protein